MPLGDGEDVAWLVRLRANIMQDGAIVEPFGVRRFLASATQRIALAVGVEQAQRPLVVSALAVAARLAEEHARQVAFVCSEDLEAVGVGGHRYGQFGAAQGERTVVSRAEKLALCHIEQVIALSCLGLAAYVVGGIDGRQARAEKCKRKCEKFLHAYR